MNTSEGRPFAVPIRYGATSTLFLVAILILFLCFAIWIVWTEFAVTILNGEPLRSDLLLVLLVLLLMSTGIVYVLIFTLMRFFRKTRYYWHGHKS